MEWMKRIKSILSAFFTQKQSSTSLKQKGGKNSNVLVEEKPNLYWLPVFFWTLFVFGVFYFYVHKNWSSEEVTTILGINLPRIVAILLTVWVADAFLVIKVNEFGAVTFFGIAAKTFNSGPKIAPRGLFTRFIYRSDVYEEFWPAKPDLISYVDDNTPIQEGFTRAWRFLTGTPKEIVGKKGENAKRITEANVLDVQQFVSMSGFMTWRVKREKVFEFIIASEGDVTQVRTQILGLVKGTLTQEVSKYTVGVLNTKLAEVAEGLKDEILKNLGEYGIEVLISRIDPANFSHGLAEAQRNLNISRAGAVKTQIEAEARKYSTIKDAEARKEEIRLALEGEGEGIKKAAELMNIEPGEVFAGKVAEKTIGETDTVILGTESFQNVLGGLSSTILKGLKNKGGTK
jgi:regulator of protease activity HflC (stomatin/prohibitin superfamily)